MAISRYLKGRVAKEEAVLIGDPRVEGWESVSTFEDQRTALAWRDQLRSLGIDASCVQISVVRLSYRSMNADPTNTPARLPASPESPSKPTAVGEPVRA